jgi:hypothetical protein
MQSQEEASYKKTQVNKKFQEPILFKVGFYAAVMSHINFLII